MNNQIDKLMVKAGAYFGGEGVDYSNFDPKKFAELIVRECADVAKETRWAVPPSQEQIARGIQQHFGVEE